MIRALKLDGIALPPWKIAAELKGRQARENIMIEESAQSAGIMATDFKSLPQFMPGAAITFYSGDGSHYFAAYSWI